MPTTLAGVHLVEMEPRNDERGFFARSWCGEEFAKNGLSSELIQCSVSYNHRRGTLRGLHYQRDPHGESKLVRCTMGAVWDVVVDIRIDSQTRGQWYSAELTAENRRAVYIPNGCAHGFLTLTDHTELLYQISTPYVPEAASGLRWDSRALRIGWPFQPTVVSARDLALPEFES